VLENGKKQMIEYIAREIIRRPQPELDVNTPLVSTGLIDSLALVDIVQKLEDLTNLRIPGGKVRAQDMDTVNLMFSTAQRVGRPKN
jgi:acyl carrier protein